MPTTQPTPGPRAGWGALLSRARPVPGRAELEVAALWGDTLLELRRLAPDEELTIGERHTLVRRHHGRAELVPPEDARLALCGTELPRDAAAALTLQPGQTVRVDQGRLAWLVRYAPVEPRPLADPRDRDFRFFKVLAATFLGAAALLFAWSLVGPVDSLSDEVVLRRPEIARRVFTTPKPVELPRPTARPQAAREPSKPTPRFEAAPQHASGPVDRERVRRSVQDKGLLKGFAALGPASAVLFAGPGLGRDLSAALDQVGRGGHVGDAHGVGGSRGVGPGGGPGGLGIGGVGSIDGHGPGGPGNLHLGGGDGAGHTRVQPRELKVAGGLEPGEIQRVIQRHQNEIRFCFNTEFQKDPSLGGKLAVRFTIGPDGGVASADADQNSTQSAALESCVLARVQRWRFPQPKGGGVVVVSYPWIFSGAGQE